MYLHISTFAYHSKRVNRLLWDLGVRESLVFGVKGPGFYAPLWSSARSLLSSGQYRNLGPISGFRLGTVLQAYFTPYISPEYFWSGDGQTLFWKTPSGELIGLHGVETSRARTPPGRTPVPVFCDSGLAPETLLRKVERLLCQDLVGRRGCVDGWQPGLPLLTAPPRRSMGASGRKGAAPFPRSLFLESPLNWERIHLFHLGST